MKDFIVNMSSHCDGFFFVLSPLRKQLVKWFIAPKLCRSMIGNGSA